MSSSAGASERGLRARRGAAALALAVVLAAGARPAAAQEAPPPVVERVVIEVDGRPGEAGLLDLVPIRPGDPFRPALVDQALKQIFRTGLFADARVEKRGEERIELLFSLVRKVVIADVRFRGVEVPSERLRDDLVSLRPGGALDEEDLPAAVEEVRRGLRREGFFDAQVAGEVLRRPGASTAVLVFRTTAWKRFRVGGLEVEWKAEIPERALLQRMKTRVGDLYVPSRLAADIDRLAAGLARAGYRRAEVRLTGESFDEQSRRVDLVVGIQPNEKVVIAVNGAKVPARLLEPIWEERVFEPWGLAEGEARILNHLRRKGYLFAGVESRVEKGRDELRIVHDVAPGARHKLLGLEFRGNKAFSDPELKTRLAVREGVPLLSFLDYDRLFTIPREVEGYYRESGFADARVRLELERREEGVQAVFEVQEGARTVVDAVRIEGAALFPAAVLAEQLVSRPGGPYFAPNPQKDAGQIEAFYLDHGVRGTSVVPRVEPAGEGRVALVYEVEEGEAVTVRNVFVTGNRATRNRIIRREIEVEKGGPADSSRIQGTKRRLEGLGIFSDVRVDEVRTGPGEEVVVVTVREGERNYTGFGLGFESRSRLSGSLATWPDDFRPRVAAEYIRSNVFGLGAQAGALGQFSTRERRGVLSWSQPYVLGLAMPTTLLGWAEREQRRGFTFDRRGVSLSVVKSLSRARLLLGSLSLTRTAIPEVDIEDPPEEIDRRFLPYSAALASVSMSWERRDDTLNPTRGLFFSLVGEWGVPLFGMASDYQKVFAKFQFLRPLSSALNLDLTARLGLGRGLRHLPERFFAGGSNTFRGEEFEMLGPLDAKTLKPYGGEAVLLVNTEFAWAVVPSWRELRFVAFFDLGNTYASLGAFRPLDLLGAAGAGLRYRTPLGPVRVEVAWKLWGFDVQDRKGRPLVFLTIGHIF
ncbi:MAG TPA: POTRA domain-containing protein [Candidatus Aminicenantes bacterium]|nr:POTRA domain-containing protein [Candidatus Aminicenantes bacterium]